MAKPIATVEGIALAPGVSRNGRWYKPEHVAGMVRRVQAKLASGESIVLRDGDAVESHVVTMLSHHAAEDDRTRIVGRVRSMSLDDQGRARFKADIAPTEAGRTIATLLDTSDGQPPFLRGVSGRMAWVGGARIVKGPDGEPVETGADSAELDLLGLDYTHRPGVAQAVVDTFAWTNGGQRAETADCVLIYESVENAMVTAITEETTPVRAPQRRHQFRNGVCLVCNPAEALTPVNERRAPMPATMTRAQFNRRLDELCDKYRDGATPALARQLNEALSSFKASAVITETTAPTRPAARPATARPAAKPAKVSKRQRRIIAAAVRESLTAAGAPQPPPGNMPKAAPKAATPTVPLHRVDVDQLAAMTAQRLGAETRSPFWSVRESGPAAPIAESTAAAAERDLADLASLSSDGLNAVFDRLNQRRGLASPLWTA
jgi:hypothetical protein